MDSEAKVIHHGTTVINTPPAQAPPQGYPPPYSSSAQPHPSFQPHPGYPAPGPIYGGPPQPVHGVIIAQTPPTVTVIRPMGPRPTQVTCKSCNAEVVTRIETSATTRTHIIALLLCVFGCWPCACIPYCMDDCMNANHYCPNCNSYLGSYAN